MKTWQLKIIHWLTVVVFFPIHHYRVEPIYQFANQFGTLDISIGHIGIRNLDIGYIVTGQISVKELEYQAMAISKNIYFVERPGCRIYYPPKTLIMVSRIYWHRSDIPKPWGKLN